MLHPATVKQFEAVKARYPTADIQQLPSGAALVSIPNFPVPAGWSANTTCVEFIVPVGYPGPCPDCFWATAGLRLHNGAMPHASQEPNTIPEVGRNALWFSWHVVNGQANWDPNRDTLSTYVAIIAERFRRPQ